MNGSERIAAERKRQVEEEGWTPRHDEGHTEGQLALAAACYAASTARRRIFVSDQCQAGWFFSDPWPWLPKFDKRPRKKGYLSHPTEEQALALLVQAGALIAAEIDRRLQSSIADAPNQEGQA